MRNDDQDAVEVLERAIRAAEREIAELQRENRALESRIERLTYELHTAQCPTLFGEPVINAGHHTNTWSSND
jgi:cell division protein FtsB